MDLRQTSFSAKRQKQPPVRLPNDASRSHEYLMLNEVEHMTIAALVHAQPHSFAHRSPEVALLGGLSGLVRQYWKNSSCKHTVRSDECLNGSNSRLFLTASDDKVAFYSCIGSAFPTHALVVDSVFFLPCSCEIWKSAPARAGGRMLATARCDGRCGEHDARCAPRFPRWGWKASGAGLPTRAPVPR
jgi:hypothetical protein